MTAAQPRRPVAVSHLRLERPATGGRHIAAAPRMPQPAQAVRLQPLSGAPLSEIRKIVRNTMVSVVPDRSGSIWATWGGDPDDAIGAAGESLLALMRRSGGGAAQIVPWGSDAPASAVVGPLDVRTGAKRLRYALRNRRSMGGNNMPAALRRTAEQVSTRPDGETQVIVVPTDGIEIVTADTHAALAELPPSSVHLLLLDPLRGCTQQMEDDWRSLALGGFNRAEKVTASALAKTVGDIFATTLGLHLGAPAPEPDADDDDHGENDQHGPTHNHR